MANASHIRGLLLEEAILELLKKSGYTAITSEDQDIESGPSGLYVKGRGGRHQVDAIVKGDFAIPFTFPMRLIVEAKAYLPKYNNGRVGLPIVRSVVGVYKDINENFFSHLNSTYRRYSYHYAVFSLNGFTRDAEQYALAHEIFLFQYHYNSLFKGIRSLLNELTKNRVQNYFNIHTKYNEKDLRQLIRDLFKGKNADIASEYIKEEGMDFLREFVSSVESIGGSYFDLINGEYPVHITSTKPIADISKNSDILKVKLYIEDNSLAVIIYHNQELFFELPEYHMEQLKKAAKKENPLSTRNKILNYISVFTINDGIRRILKLELDNDWLIQVRKRQ